VSVLALAFAYVGANSHRCASGESPSTAGKTGTPPRTPEGQPDLQEVWNSSTLTPFERPKEFAGMGAMGSSTWKAVLPSM
jgi:hypothetical protein